MQNNIIIQIRRCIIYLVLFLFPLFFLPITEEYFNLSKFYFLAFAILIILSLYILEILAFRKITFRKSWFDKPIILFLFSIVISVLVASPNKVEGLLEPVEGALMLVFLIILYFILMQQKDHHDKYLKILFYSAGITSLTAIIFFFSPLGGRPLPTYLGFLKNPEFSPLGTSLDQAAFLGFFSLWGILSFLKNRQKTLLTLFTTILIVIGFSLSLYNLVKPLSSTQPKSAFTKSKNQLSLLPSFSVSWVSAVETLKNPVAAIFGVGPANFASVFTRAKSLDYNKGDTWNVAFNHSGSYILGLWAGTGLLGLLSFFFLILHVFRSIYWSGHSLRPGHTKVEDSFTKLKIKISLSGEMLLFIYFLLVMLFIPAQSIVLFLFFVFLSTLMEETADGQKAKVLSFDLDDQPAFYIGISVIGILIIGASFYYLGRSYLAEYYYKKSLDSYAAGDARKIYETQRQSILINPYIERFHITFANLNLLIAGQVASKKASKITTQDRTNITQAIQAAIAEGKAAVSLNPQKAGNWESLAMIYRNILNVAQGADVWTISSFQRAILADPFNPLLRLNLGGVYYGKGQFDEAIKLFEEAVNLKSDWPNSQYNLAWSYFQQKEYAKAASTMQTVLNLIDPASNDYKKAQNELNDFKKKLVAEKEATPQNPSTQENLTLPTTPEPVISPKINLPEEASPESQTQSTN